MHRKSAGESAVPHHPYRHTDDRPQRPQPRGVRSQGRWVAWWRADRGSVAAEVTLVTPFLIMLLVFIAVVIHRGVDARLRVEDAAHQAARAASIQRTRPAASNAAQSTAANALSAAGVVCRSLSVHTATAGLVPGGAVTVTVSCSVDLSDALLLGGALPQRVSATAREPVDTYRSLPVNASAGSP